MGIETKKPNPYVIIIIVLVVIIAGLAYSKWGGGFLPSGDKSENNGTSSNIDTSFSGGDIVLGKQDAPVTIIEYYSYFCGYCKLFDEETKPKLIKDYIGPGKVKLVFRSFPPIELGASVLCANDQGKFLEYHNELFAKASELEQADDLKKLAENIDLDTGEFNQCFDSGKYADQSENWYNQANADFEKAGVPEDQRGTPAFFINGELLFGALPYDDFVEVIERKLTE